MPNQNTDVRKGEKFTDFVQGKIERESAVFGVGSPELGPVQPGSIQIGRAKGNPKGSFPKGKLSGGYNVRNVFRGLSD